MKQKKNTSISRRIFPEQMADMEAVFRMFAQLNSEQRAYILGVITGIDMATDKKIA